MGINKKIIITKILLIFALCILAYNIVETGLKTIYFIYIEQIIPLLEVDVLFSSLVVTIGLLMLWKVQKTEFILLILGEIFVLIGTYNASLSKLLSASIEIIGLVLFTMAFIKISFFLISKRADQFIQSFFEGRKWGGSIK